MYMINYNQVCVFVCMYETGHGATDTLLVSNCHQTISPVLCTVVCECVCVTINLSHMGFYTEKGIMSW